MVKPVKELLDSVNNGHCTTISAFSVTTLKATTKESLGEQSSSCTSGTAIDRGETMGCRVSERAASNALAFVTDQEHRRVGVNNKNMCTYMHYVCIVEVFELGEQFSGNPMEEQNEHITRRTCHTMRGQRRIRKEKFIEIRRGTPLTEFNNDVRTPNIKGNNNKKGMGESTPIIIQMSTKTFSCTYGTASGHGEPVGRRIDERAVVNAMAFVTDQRDRRRGVDNKNTCIFMRDVCRCVYIKRGKHEWGKPTYEQREPTTTGISCAMREQLRDPKKLSIKTLRGIPLTESNKKLGTPNKKNFNNKEGMGEITSINTCKNHQMSIN